MGFEIPMFRIFSLHVDQSVTLFVVVFFIFVLNVISGIKNSSSGSVALVLGKFLLIKENARTVIITSILFFLISFFTSRFTL